MFKRAAIMLFCLIMIFIATFGFIVGVVAVPTIYSYAAVNDDPIYVPLRDPSDAVVAFQAYCKSRDLTIEGSLADAVTTFTTGAFNSACNELGINITQLQAEIKAEYDQSGKPVKFFLNDTGVMAMNRIFAEFLQDNELEVGDSANEENNTVYSGDIFTDDTGNSCLVYIVNKSVTGSSMFSIGPYDQQYLVSLGTTYMYDGQTLANMYESNGDRFYVNFNVGGHTSNYGSWISRTSQRENNITYYNYGTSDIFYTDTESSAFADVMYSTKYAVNGNLAIAYNTFHSKWAVCSFTKYNGNYYLFPLRYDFIPNSGTTNNVIVFLNTNNTVINNNVYEGDTYITNEGDVINDPTPVPPGGTDPGWDIGGGGGTATDGNGNTWNIQFPDFQLPDLNIDWSINGLGDKFPFSIPFDLVALVTVLNAEPQAPRFEGTVNFGFTTWDYDINLQQFDSVAQACRIAELLLLVVGLILVTRSIIKG